MSISKEIFGIERKPLQDKAYTCKQECVDIGYNKALNEIDQHELSEEAMAKIICNEWYDLLGRNINRGQACDLFAKALRSNQSKLFVRKSK